MPAMGTGVGMVVVLLHCRGQLLSDKLSTKSCLMRRSYSASLAECGRGAQELVEGQ